MLETGHHYRDQVSKLISWGHWFSLANILLAIVLATRYLFIADWPITALGQTYSVISLLGHFSFIIFVLYLALIFPISFIIPFQRTLRFVTVIVATIGISLLAIDSEIFKLYNLHINPIIFEILLSKSEQELHASWQGFFIFIPFIFLLELLISGLIWHKLRKLGRFKLGPIVAIFFLMCFLVGHLLHMWADAAVYRPITAQKANFPLSYPMTARTFLTKHGWLDQKAFEQRISDNDETETFSRLDYPKHDIVLNSQRKNYNVLFINISTLRADMLNPSVMPEMTALAQQATQFSSHFSTSNDHRLGNFSLLYGLAPQYWGDIETSSAPSVLLQYFLAAKYKLGIFSSDDLNRNRQRQTSFVNLSEDNANIVDSTDRDAETVIQANKWIGQQRKPWFAYLSLNSVQNMAIPEGFPSLFYPNIQDLNSQARDRYQALFNSYRNSANYLDTKIAQIILTLKKQHMFGNTVIVFTSNHGSEFNDAQNHTWGYGSNYSIYQTQVPLFIVWPGKQPEVITHDSSHVDVVPTLLKNLSALNNPISDYSNGRDLFSDPEREWQLLGTENVFVILGKETISLFSYQGLLSSQGHHEVRSRENYKLLRATPLKRDKFEQILSELNYFYKSEKPLDD